MEKMTRKQASEYLGIAYQTLGNDVVTGNLRIPFHKYIGRCYYKKSELDAWIEKNTKSYFVNG